MDDFINYKIVKYNEQYKKEWDFFVNIESINGTFLHTRNFLNYHPKGRFIDNSYMIYDRKGKLAAVIPACLVIKNEKKVLCSHKGSTFGGIVINKKNYRVEKIISIVEIIEKQAIKEEIDEIEYKVTSSVYSIEPDSLFEYIFFNKGYKEYKELNLLVNYSNYNDNIIKNLSKGKKYSVSKSEKAGCKFIQLDSKNEIIEFYNILCNNLNKYNVKPVHTVDELIEFKDFRLKNGCSFFGIELNQKIVAGAMMFYFNKVNVAHTQYLCALPEYDGLSPMSFLYYSLIKEMKIRGYKKLTWGIVTEEQGKYLNMGLANSKEAFGGEYSINRIYSKILK